MGEPPFSGLPNLQQVPTHQAARYTRRSQVRSNKQAHPPIRRSRSAVRADDHGSASRTANGLRCLRAAQRAQIPALVGSVILLQSSVLCFRATNRIARILSDARRDNNKGSEYIRNGRPIRVAYRHSCVRIGGRHNRAAPKKPPSVAAHVTGTVLEASAPVEAWYARAKPQSGHGSKGSTTNCPWTSMRGETPWDGEMVVGLVCM